MGTRLNFESGYINQPEEPGYINAHEEPEPGYINAHAEPEPGYMNAHADPGPGVGRIEDGYINAHAASPEVHFEDGYINMPEDHGPGSTRHASASSRTSRSTRTKQRPMSQYEVMKPKSRNTANEYNPLPPVSSGNDGISPVGMYLQAKPSRRKAPAAQEVASSSGNSVGTYEVTIKRKSSGYTPLPSAPVTTDAASEKTPRWRTLSSVSSCSSARSQKFKVALLGASKVGKTSLVKALQGKVFEMDEAPTNGMDKAFWSIVDEDDTIISFEICDTGGIGGLNNLEESVRSSCSGIILCYAIDDKASWNVMKDYYFAFMNERNVGGQQFPTIIVGTKQDLQHERTVTAAEVAQFAKQINCSVMVHTSSRTGFNVQVPFGKLLPQMKEWERTQPVISGWLEKRGGGSKVIGKAFRRRWFAMYNGMDNEGVRIVYAADPSEKSRGTISLSPAELVEIDQLSFNIVDISAKRTYYIRGDSDSEIRKWITAIKAYIRGK